MSIKYEEDNTATLDKRGHSRSSLNLIVNFRELNQKGLYSHGITNNLSYSGLCLESSSFDFPRGRLLDIVLKHPQSEFTLSVFGEVVWQKVKWYHCISGIKFTETDAQSIASMIDTISALKEEHIDFSFHCRPENIYSDEGPANNEAEQGQVKNKIPLLNQSPSHTADLLNVSPPDTLPTSPAGRSISAPPSPPLQKKTGWIPGRIFVSIAIVLAGIGIFKSESLSKAAQSLIPPALYEMLNKYPDSNMNTEGTAGGPGASILTPAVGKMNDEDVPSGKIVGHDMSTADESPVTHLSAEDNGHAVPQKRLSHSSPETIANEPPGNFRGEITFDINSDIIAPSFGSEVDKVVTILSADPQAYVKVQGHADGMGPEVYNLDLAMRRALAVKKLLNKKGIDTNQIKIIVYGDTEPIAPNTTVTGRRKNRRVEMDIIPPSMKN